MTRRLPVATTVLALFAPGCTVDQQSEISRYRAVSDLSRVPAFSPGAPLSLEDAVLLANAYNERLSIQGELYLQALLEQKRRAAALMPTLDLFGDQFLRENNSALRSTAFDGGVSGQYTLLTGATDFNSVKAAEADARSRRWLLLDLREALMLETARAYYSVLRAERLVEVLRSSSVVQQERLRDIRARQAVGFARPLDVAQIESQSSETMVTLLDAQNALARARSALILLTGVEAQDSLLTDGFAIPDSTPALTTLLTDAYRTRQDLLAARASADAARADVDAAFGQYFPSIRLALDYFLVRDSAPTDLDLSSLISINLPLFTGWRIDAEVRAAWSVFRQRVLEYSALRRQVRLDIETALADLDSSRQRVVELNAQLAAAAEALRQAEASYQAGLGTNLERVAAQDQLLNAQLRQASEEFTLKIAVLALQRAGGRLTQDLAFAPPVAAAPEEQAPPDSPFIILPPAAGMLPRADQRSP